ncbi:DUF3574 domain-containing protein [Pseudoalteromonas luteoviolacea]|uniref:DUF3574 domain-containing protein n=1 Tax=Pseudoalteromonas luteoviolacea TaxID=43657 RepID=UPI001B38E51D|nr:DUF3574 domain-containing protein [Pseudoalteromonas luteoviolacea]
MNYKSVIGLVCFIMLSGCVNPTSTIHAKTSQPAAIQPQSTGIKMYFGLSIPTGGVVTPQQWQQFESNQVANTFTGFSVADSVGYYKGKKEHAKVITIYNASAADIEAANKLGKQYAQLFNQDSVLVVLIDVAQIQFVTKD